MNIDLTAIKKAAAKIAEVVGGAIAGDAIIGAVGEVVKKTGENLTPADMQHFKLWLTGKLPYEDENLVLRAEAELDKKNSAITIAHDALVAQLPDDHNRNLYRLFLIGAPNPALDQAADEERRIEQAMAIIEAHAGLTDGQWKTKFNNLGLHQTAATSKTKFDTFMSGLGAAGSKIAQTSKQFSDDLERDTGMEAGAKKVQRFLLAEIKRKLS